MNLKKDSKITWTPHNYQKRAVKHITSNVVSGLFMSPGMGKTSSTLKAISTLIKNKTVNRVLIIGPLRVIDNVWPDEIKKWKNFQHLTSKVLHGENKNVNEITDEHIHLINPEGLDLFVEKRTVDKNRWGQPIKEKTIYELKKEFRRKFPYDMLVVDESTRFKHSNTSGFKRLKQMLPLFKRRVILTGTPAPNGLLDLFGQIYILDLGRALGAYITHYRNKFFYPTGYGGYTWKLKPYADIDIYAAIRPYILTLTGKDYLELPPLVRSNVYVDLPSKARTTYNQMEDELIAELQNNTVIAKNSAVATMKCRQIASGGLIVSTSKKKAEQKSIQIHKEKIEATRDILDELGGKPALILFEFSHELEHLLKAFGKDTPFISGGMTRNKTKMILEEWNTGQHEFMFAQIEAIAHGLNLQATGRAVIYYSMTWDLESYEQAFQRIWRQGQKQTTFLFHIIARNTTDEVMLDVVVKDKAKTQNDLLQALKRRLLRA